jgi:hypothetical protein
MVLITVDYEGRSQLLEADQRDTHVVASTGADGNLNLEPTHTPAETMAHMQQAGDEDCRVATIEGGRVNFTAVPEFDASEESVARADRRGRAVEMAVLVALLVVVAMAIWLLV